MFKKRLISGAILLAAVIVLIVIGRLPLFIFNFAIGIIGLFEFYRTRGVEKDFLAILGYIIAAGYMISVLTAYSYAPVMGLAGSVLILMAAYVIKYPQYRSDDIFFILGGILYIPFTLSFIYLSRNLAAGACVTALIFISAWGNDTCAYCVGMKFGKKKIFPELSPKKSLEGLIGGIAGAALLGLIFGAIFNKFLSFSIHPAFACMIICAVAGFISVLGDLTASAIKRESGVKDYGNLIPGHGGVMDRFDSLTFAAPAVYIAAIFLGI
ncbi:MAG: phosphatidate cytidylyltransferase [Lachnospiraceae bacterium]|nr:phosphatidate cytidylyltransferase [Lachnospiraceae bacterium]